MSCSTSSARAPDVRRFVASIEEWIIRALAAFNVRGERRDDRVGVWVRRPDKGPRRDFEDKIAAIGIRVRQWVTLHGFALNVEPDLTHFAGIVPCGVSDRRFGVTSLADLGRTLSMPEVDMALRAAFEPLFGATADAQTLPSSENNSPLPAERNISRPRFALNDALDPRARRSLPARVDHIGHSLFGADEDRFDRAIAAVAHPTLNAALERCHFGPGPITDALHAAADRAHADARSNEALQFAVACAQRTERQPLFQGGNVVGGNSNSPRRLDHDFHVPGLSAGRLGAAAPNKPAPSGAVRHN